MTLGGHWGSRGVKNRFPTEEAARAAAERRSVELDAEFYSYRCNVCDDWHYGRRRPKPSRRKDSWWTEPWEPELGVRAAAILLAENSRSGLAVIGSAGRAVGRRLDREAAA